jgi:transposase
MPAPYPLEFRQEAVRLLRSSGKPVPQLASELGVSPQSLRNWAREILNKAAVFFAREGGTR